MIKGKIKEIYEDGTAMIIAPIDLYKSAHVNAKECYVDYIDGRKLDIRSESLRRTAYCREKLSISSSTKWSLCN